MLAFVLHNTNTCAHNTSTRIFITLGYVWPIKTLDPDYLAPKQFSKMAEGSDDFPCVCVCVEFRFHLGHPYCLRFRSCLCLCLRSAKAVRVRGSLSKSSDWMTVTK